MNTLHQGVRLQWQRVFQNGVNVITVLSVDYLRHAGNIHVVHRDRTCTCMYDVIYIILHASTY